MTGYIFIPIPTPEMLEFAEDWQNGQKAKGKTPYQILKNSSYGTVKRAIQKVGFGVLRNITVADKVYILAHGNGAGSLSIGTRRNNTKVNNGGISQWQEDGTLKTYTAAELAALLEREGLPKNNLDIRVFACGSANVPSTATRSFAESLAAELVSRGYPNSIKITGYLGNVRSSYSVRQIPNQIGQYTSQNHKGVEIGGEIFPASTRKVVF